VLEGKPTHVGKMSKANRGRRWPASIKSVPPPPWPIWHASSSLGTSYRPIHSAKKGLTVRLLTCTRRREVVGCIYAEVPWLLSSLTALAQQHAPQDTLDAAIQAVRTADNAHFQEAAAAREEARALLNRTPVTSPRFVSWVQQVADLYQNGSLGADARSVLEEALNRSVPLAESHPSHIALLMALGDFWQRDGNLMKAVGYFEQAAATPEATPSKHVQPAPQGFVYYPGEFYYPSPTGSRIQAYVRLANLYQTLTRLRLRPTRCIPGAWRIVDNLLEWPRSSKELETSSIIGPQCGSWSRKTGVNRSRK
jgi:hypothetical protein